MLPASLTFMIRLMFPILTRYDSIFIYSFTVIMAVGVVAVTLLTARLQRSDPIRAWFDALLWVFAGGMIGGRLGFILGQWAYYQENPSEILHIWQGGLSYHGALIAGLAALFIWTRFTGYPFYDYAGLFSPGFTMLVAFGWLACWFDGCAYGQETLIGPLTADLPDKFGIFALRYQTQMIGLVLSLAAFGAVLWAYHRLPPMFTFWLAMMLVSSSHMAVGLLRGDPAYQIWQVRLDILLDGALIALSLLMLQFSTRTQDRDDQ